MKLWHSAFASVLLMTAGLSPAWATEVEVKLPAGYASAQLLSPGTGAVLKHYRSQLDRELKRLDAQFQLTQRQAELEQAELKLATSRTQLNQQTAMLRQASIARVRIQTHSAAVTDLGSSSTMGDIDFFYTVTNNTGHIVGSLVYQPMVGQLRIPTTSNLYLDLIDFATMRFGLVPGASLSNQGFHPERLSFFAGELKGGQLAEIKRSIASDFRLEIVDIKFLRQTGYKGQTQELSFDEAFAGELGPLRAAVSQAERELARARELAAETSRGLAAAKQQDVSRFAQAAGILQISSRRYQASQARFTGVEPGTYWLYAKGPGGWAIFEKVWIHDARRQKIKSTNMRPDPFKP